MNNKNLNELLAKYRSDTCTEDEKMLLEDWISSTTFPEYQVSEEEIMEDLAELRSTLPLSIKTTRLWPRIAAAASVVLAIGLGWYFYPGQSKETSATVIATTIADIKPGRFSATLTLANGSNIALNNSANGKLADQAGAAVVKTANGQIAYQNNGISKGPQTNILSTAKGEQYIVVLPDGSKVWLNAATSIQYPTTFAGLAERKVVLNGEAYFEVAKDKMHPFVVETSEQRVKVLGTHFNVNSYVDEKATKTTLLEGSVGITPANKKQISILAPGQQALLTSIGLKISAANVNAAIDWKNGKFIFEDESLGVILRKVARWYNLEVVYQQPALSNLIFTGTISRYEDVTNVLSKLELTEDVKFKIEGRKISVNSIK